MAIGQLHFLGRLIGTRATWLSRALLFLASLAFFGAVHANETARTPDMEALRTAYAGPPADWPRPLLQPDAVFSEFGPLSEISYPADNPPTAEKMVLGEMLFNEPKLSRSGQIACASCHARELGFGDGLSTSFGHDRQRGPRNAMPLHAAPWMQSLFWDGRASSLEEQAIASITNPVEMAADPADVARRIAADEGLMRAFARSFPDKPLTMERITQALATYMRGLKPRFSKWDRVMQDGTQVLSDAELRGLDLFRTKAGCANCHNGPLFTDQRFHNIGLSYYGRRLQDLGRYEITGDPADVGAFRTPSLRNVSRTGPYMHNGVFPTLQGIVNFYNAGGVRLRPGEDQLDDPLFPETTAILLELDLTKQEREDLVAFLETL